MIHFSLVCDHGHGFESWFRDGRAYEEQAAAGLLACPACGSAAIDKAVMAPRIARKDREASPSPVEAPMTLVSSDQAEFRRKLKELRDHVTANSVDVGARFAEEARKIHFGEVEHRSIRGQATLDDARGLAEDGIEFHPLPDLPDERN